MTCVTSSTFSLSINGGSHGFIRGKRGLRQGDPMSPSLFVLCMEYLSRLLAKNTSENDFSFHPKCDMLNINHLAFADDLMLFGRGDTRSMKILADTLNEFSTASGLRISIEKSTIFMAGVGEYEAKEIKELFGFQTGCLPTKYLGLPLASRKLNMEHYEPLVAQITTYLNKWSNRSLSLAGRIELTRSILQGVECYWIQALALPVGIIDRITSIIRRFVWGTRTCPVAWKDVCKPKEEGGLAIRDLATWNRALLAKNLWNIQAKTDALWIQWIHMEFLRCKTLWEWQPSTRDSPTIKNLLAVRDQILEKVGGNIQAADDLLKSWNGQGGVSKAYDFLRPKNEKQFWHKAIWKPYIPPRWSISLWLALRGRFKTLDRLKFLDIVPICPICEETDETHDHLFFACRKLRAIWDKVKRWIGMSRQMNTIASALKHIKRSKTKGSGIQAKAGWLAVAATVNHCWKARNLLCFEKKPVDVQTITDNIRKDVYMVLYSLFPVERVLEHLPDRKV